MVSKEGIQVDRINSCFGSVAFSIRADETSGTIVARVSPPTRNRPRHVWLYVRLPSPRKMASVEIDGRPWTKFDAEQERIELPPSDKPLEVKIR